MTNRWVQLGASVVAMVMIANLQYAWTLFVRPIQERRGGPCRIFNGALRYSSCSRRG